MTVEINACHQSAEVWPLVLEPAACGKLGQAGASVEFVHVMQRSADSCAEMAHVKLMQSLDNVFEELCGDAQVTWLTSDDAVLAQRCAICVHQGYPRRIMVNRHMSHDTSGSTAQADTCSMSSTAAARNHEKEYY